MYQSGKEMLSDLRLFISIVLFVSFLFLFRGELFAGPPNSISAPLKMTQLSERLIKSTFAENAFPIIGQGAFSSYKLRKLPLPKGNHHDFQFARLRLGQKPLVDVVAFSDVPNVKEPNLFAIDENRNKRLDDDAIRKLPKHGEIHLISLGPKGYEQSFFIKLTKREFRQKELDWLLLMPSSIPMGTLKLSDGKHSIALLDLTRDGKYGKGDQLFIDLDGDGQFHSTPGRNERFGLYRYLLVNDQIFTYEFDEGFAKITLEPFTGEKGTLELICRPQKNIANTTYSVVLFPAKKDENGHLDVKEQISLTRFGPTCSIVLPTGDYLLYSRLCAANAKSMLALHSTKIRIDKGKVTSLKLLAPTVKSTITRSGDKLEVVLVVTSGELEYGYLGKHLCKENSAYETDNDTRMELFTESESNHPICTSIMSYG